MATLTTAALQITPAGPVVPSFADVLAFKTAQYQGIFGSDVVLDASVQDQQYLQVKTQAVVDCNQMGLMVYQSFRPGGAVGAGLSSIVKINGLGREVPSNSSAPVAIGGTAGTIITSGLVSDGTYQWALPASVTIPPAGTITETATCTTQGAISAPAGTINQIVNPQRGWQTAVSTGDAAQGAPVETDTQLTQRQGQSTAIAAVFPIDAIEAAISNLPGVTMVKGYENDTDTTDGNGLPPHSIAMVVEGGDAVQIATTIAQKKAPGCNTYGTTSEIITSANGVPITIRFFVPTQVTVDVDINLSPKAGYVTPTGTLIQTQEAAYINGVGINGTDGYLFFSKMYSPANDTGTVANTYNVTGITFRRGGNAFGVTDIPIAFNELPVAGTMTVTVGS